MTHGSHSRTAPSAVHHTATTTNNFIGKMLCFSEKKGIIHSHRVTSWPELSVIIHWQNKPFRVHALKTSQWLEFMIIDTGDRDVSTSGVHSWNVSPDTSSLLDQISRSCTQPHTPGLVLPVGNSFTIHLVTIMQWLWQQEHNFQDSSTQSIAQVPVENVKWTRLTYWKGPSWDPDGKRVYSTRFPGIEVGNLGKMPKVKLEYRG